jgi:hypothetical protein
VTLGLVAATMSANVMGLPCRCRMACSFVTSFVSNLVDNLVDSFVASFVAYVRTATLAAAGNFDAAFGAAAADHFPRLRRLRPRYQRRWLVERFFALIQWWRRPPRSNSTVEILAGL